LGVQDPSDVVAQASAAAETGEPPAEFGFESTWTYAVEEDATEATAHFQRSAATAYSPYNSTTTWVYGGGGCIYRTGGSTWFDLDLQIPNGVDLDFLRIYFNDTDPVNDAVTWIQSYDGAGSSTNLTTASSTGTPGFSTAGSGFFSHFVDTVNESLVVRISFESATTSALEICGVRVRYSIPALFVDGFESGGTAGWDVTVP